MSLQSQIFDDIKTAMKAREAHKLEVLRMIKTAITNLAIQKGQDDLSDELVMEVLQKQYKQRKESFDSFTSAGRDELAEKEKQEMAIIETYLPEQLSEEEVRSIAEGVISELGVSDKATTGQIMKALMPKVKGKADGKLVNQVVQSLLS